MTYVVGTPNANQLEEVTGTKPATWCSRCGQRIGRGQRRWERAALHSMAGEWIKLGDVLCQNCMEMGK